MVGRVHWRAVVAGTLVMLVLGWAFGLFVARMIQPNLYGMVGLERPGGVTGGTSGQWALVGVLSPLIGLSSPLLAHVLGGVVAGGIASSSPGLNGSLTAGLAAVYGVVGFTVSVLPFVVGPAGDPRTHSENVGLIFVQAMVFAVFFPITILAGYSGGRLGGRLRRGRRSGLPPGEVR